MQAVFYWPRYCVLILLITQAPDVFAQDIQKEQTKKNPKENRQLIPTSQQDTVKPSAETIQRALPKFDLPEFVITGTSSVDLPKAEKISFEDTVNLPGKSMRYSADVVRDRETMGLKFGNNLNDERMSLNKYSGFVKAGIGSYFTPQVEIQFGQSPADYFYSLNGRYSLTEGYASNTDESKGSFKAVGGTILESSELLLRNAELYGEAGYKSESFRFYGSSTPNIQRTISDFSVQAKIENKTIKDLPYSAGISVENVNVTDSSASKNETCLDLDVQTTFPIEFLSIQTGFHFMSSTGGLLFMDLSGGINNYWYGGILFEGSLHLYWGRGMDGQNIVRLRPHLTASYQMTNRDRIYVSYKPVLVSKTLALNIGINRFLSAVPIIRHEDISNAGEIGVESEWSQAIRSRVFFNVKSIQDLAIYSDSSHQGIWMLTYGGKSTIATICAEIFAKLNSNDYFASKVLLRSAKNSNISGQIPYVPTIEADLSANHKIGSNVVVSADVKFVGERKSDIAGTTTLKNYSIVDVIGDYLPLDYLKLSIGVKNLLNTRYETWSGYREFPLTLHLSVQIKW